MEINIYKEKFLICLIQKRKYSKFNIQERIFIVIQKIHNPNSFRLIDERIPDPCPHFFFFCNARYLKIYTNSKLCLPNFPKKCWSHLQVELLEGRTLSSVVLGAC